MVPVNNIGTDQRIPLRKLPLHNAAPQHAQRHSDLRKLKPTSEIMASKDLEVSMESQSVEEGEPHGAINPNEAAVLVHSLEEAVPVFGGSNSRNRGKRYPD